MNMSDRPNTQAVRDLAKSQANYDNNNKLQQQNLGMEKNLISRVFTVYYLKTLISHTQIYVKCKDKENCDYIQVKKAANRNCS